MYFILELGQIKSTIGISQVYPEEVKILSHIKTRITASKSLLDEAKNFIIRKAGETEGDKAKLININDINEMNDKKYDYGYYMFKHNDNIHIYHKKTTIIRGMIYGHHINDSWEYVKTFQLVNYDNVDNIPTREIVLEMTTTIPSVPKLMHTQPRMDLINDLKNSSKFLNMKKKFD